MSRKSASNINHTKSLILLSVLVCILFAALASRFIQKSSYASSLFDTSYIHAVNITMSDDDWESLKSNAMEKAEYHCSISIDGAGLDDVCISTKGSSSLRGIVSDDNSSRYSLKIKFGKYIKGQTYRGLDVLNLNNNFSDASQMKDYIAYEMFRKMGVDAPLSSYAKATVNGEYYGIFLMVEDVKHGFLRRNHDGGGNLYKPESGLLAAINDYNGDEIQLAAANNTEVDESRLLDPFCEVSPYTTGADLRYTDSSLESYSDIFSNSVTSADDRSKYRVIKALKHLSEGDMEHALDTDELISYFAVHNFASNYDSYTGLLGHNYYLYECNGLLGMIPWDYNYYDSMCTEERSLLNDHAADVHVDADIYSPLTVPEDSRPMWTWIVSDDKYLSQYKSVMDTFLKTCIESGWAAGEIARVNAMIRDEVQSDPNALFTSEEYDNAVEDLLQYFELRSESIRKQLS